MNAAEKAHGPTRERRLIIAEERRGARQSYREFLAVDRGAKIPGGRRRCAGRLEDREDGTGSIGYHDDERSADGENRILNHLVDIGGG